MKTDGFLSGTIGAALAAAQAGRAAPRYIDLRASRQSVSRLDRAIRSEKDPKARGRLIAVRQVRQLGKSVSDVARYHGVSDRTVRNWLGRYDRSGSGGMKDRPKSGRPPVVKPARIEEAAKRLYKRGELTTSSLQEELRRKTGVRFHESYVRKLRRKTGLM